MFSQSSRQRSMWSLLPTSFSVEAQQVRRRYTLRWIGHNWYKGSACCDRISGFIRNILCMNMLS